jgi:hypothetical protein
MATLTPYVTPSMLINAPTGVAWDIIPYPQALTALQTEEQFNICQRATGLVDNFCNQVLRATADTEYLSGPDFRMTIQQATGNGRLVLQRWPVLQVLAVSVAANSGFPRQWQTLPSGANAAYDVENPIIGLYGTTVPSAAGEGGQSIVIAPGYVNWSLGRRGYRVAVSYLNGWPHTSLTATATSPTSTLQVDDVTAFTGAAATIYDGSTTETVTVTSVTANANLILPVSGTTVPAGPGTLNLSAPITATHAAGVVVSSLPQDIIWATILAATSQALESGIDAITIQNVPGSQTVGGHGIQELQTEYEVILAPYKRVI